MTDREHQEETVHEHEGGPVVTAVPDVDPAPWVTSPYERVRALFTDGVMDGRTAIVATGASGRPPRVLEIWAAGTDPCDGQTVLAEFESGRYVLAGPYGRWSHVYRWEATS